MSVIVYVLYSSVVIAKFEVFRVIAKIKILIYLDVDLGFSLCIIMNHYDL